MTNVMSSIFRLLLFCLIRVIDVSGVDGNSSLLKKEDLASSKSKRGGISGGFNPV